MGKRVRSEKEREAARLRTARYRVENPEKVKAALAHWYSENKQNVLDQQLMDKYGITRGQWNAMFEEQMFCCALCKTDTTGKKGWATDHDHETGRVRAVLCQFCNTGLGLFRDNPSLMRRAADYVEQHKEAQP